MRLIMTLTVLLCMCLTYGQLHAQENLDLKGTSCVPVMTVTEDSLAFKAGEKMDFILRYRWGAVNTDVGVVETHNRCCNLCLVEETV